MFDLRESNDWRRIAFLSITMLVISFVMLAQRSCELSVLSRRALPD